MTSRIELSPASSADRPTPNIRVRTLIPVTPTRSRTRAPTTSTTKVIASAASIAATTTSRPSALPPDWDISNNIDASAPGPAISGTASGKTATSGRWAASSSSPDVVVRRPECRAKTISIDKRSSRIPPAIRNAGSDIPSPFMNCSPPIPKTANTTAAISVARSAIRRRSPGRACGVIDRKIGTFPGGSKITNRVTNAVIASSSIRAGR